MKIGVLLSRVRVEEKLLFEDLERRGLNFDRIDDRELVFNLDEKPFEYDVVLERCINHSRAMYALKMLNDWGLRTVNTYNVANTCGNKFLTTQALIHHGVPSPKVKLAFTVESALAAIEELGYPVVIKPPVGSWGRLLAKLNDRQAAEAVLEHKETLGNYEHSIFYIQEFIDKPERDIRAFVIGEEVVKAVYLIANQATSTSNDNLTVIECELTQEIERIALAAAHAVGGGVLAVDLIENGDELMAIEVDYTIEFSRLGLGEELAPRIIEYVLNR